MIGKEAKNDSKPTQLDDGSWMEHLPEGWIKDNFHVRFVEVQKYGLVHKSSAQVDARVLAVSGDSQQFSMPTPSSIVERTEGRMMGRSGEMKPVLTPREQSLPKPGKFFIAHKRFGYLPHMNTLDLQVTRVGRRSDLQRKSLADRRAFNDTIKRLRVSEHSQFLRRLS